MRRLLVDFHIPPFKVGQKVNVWPNRPDKFEGVILSVDGNKLEVKNNMTGLVYQIMDHEAIKALTESKLLLEDN